MSSTGRSKMGAEPYMMLDRVQLRCYYPREIEQLSVGHPIRGGLYDPRLGPSESSDTCETCHQQGAYCPGHMGYIQLDVPVFNPLLFNFPFSIMKGTCVQCHRLTCNSLSLSAKLLLAQLRALDLGLISVAQELGSFVRDRFASGAPSDSLDGNMPTLSDEMNACKELENFFNELSQRMPATNTKSSLSYPVKNSVELRRSLIRNFCKEQLV
ncbi:unnamed protein product [Gongylonema pulchrum]|uniref:DNA-directed RNA polymerase n=1 Tax=Gongylonema pulchrum TaxID=637853 RepID=A0A183EHK7_9BILA|nr:unnamed protein product [Gongylonema pulchrum]